MNTEKSDLGQTREKVFRYYKASTEDYLTWYQSDWHHHMHYGFERDLAKGGNPTDNLVRYMSEQAVVTADDFVLDAGCGVGGASIWLAEHLGCRTVGLNIMEMQLRLAKLFSLRHGTSEKTNFSGGDFTRLPFKPGSFDVIWATESFCHAPDKRVWIREMFRLLRPGGRLIVADGFRTEDLPEGGAERKRYDSFLAGWAVPDLCSPKEFEAWSREAGFETVKDEDISDDVAPHAKAIFRFGLVFIPVRWVLNKLGITPDEKLGNAVATYHQYTTFRRKLWTYRITVSRKAK